jgi:hypothetical protein
MPQSFLHTTPRCLKLRQRAEVTLHGQESVYSLCFVKNCQVTGTRTVPYAIVSRKTVHVKRQMLAMKLP